MHPGKVRIISGTHRGRKIPVPAHLPVRPTPDRMKETLFNWLAPHLHQARCWDAFAGTGALGIEAASRGAAWVCLSDAHPEMCAHLNKIKSSWPLPEVEVQHCLLPQQLPVVEAPFDIIFLDPPYHQGLIDAILERLPHTPLMHSHTLIYLEQAADESLRDDVTAPFECLKHTRVGSVVGKLIRPHHVG